MSNNLAGLALVLLLELVAASSAAAQSLYADRFMLNLGGPCAITSGAAAPNGAMIGNVCDTYVQTSTGAIWTKTSGTGTSSGWLATLAGQGTPGALVKWTGTGATLGDSIVSEAAGLLTVAGSATITGTGTMAAAAVTGTATIGTAAITGNATIGGTAGITGNTTLGGWIGTASYASQVTGWRITSGGAADVRYLFTDELRAKLFTADAESVLAGSMRVTTSYSTVAQPFTCPAAGATSPLWVFDASTYGDAPVFQAGHFLVIHVMTRAAFGPFTITDCVGSVSGYVDGSGANAGQQSWTFTRAAGTNGGAMTGGTVVAVNQLVQDMGVSGSGYVEMSAVDGPGGSNAPYLQTNTWTTSPVAANTTTNCRLGNLNGLTALNDYGLLCGNFVVNGPFFWMSTRGIEMRNMALTMFDNGAQVFTVDPHAGSPLLALGNPMPVAFAGSNAGLWAGKDTDGAYKIRIGNPTGNRLTYANGTLTIAGEGSGITNINGGNIQAGTITAAQLNITAHPGGAALNPDPNTSDPSMYVSSGNPAFTPAVITTITDGIVGTTSLRSRPGTQAAMSQPNTPVDVHKTYRIHAWARSGGGATSPMSIRMNTFGGNNGYLGEIGIAIESVTVPTTWTEYIGTIGPAQFPAATVNMSVEIYLNYPSPGAGYTEVQDVRIEEMLPSTLIKDGVITTNKIAAHTITAANILANSITVAELDATGFGDNVIKNGTFEGTTLAQALAGWSPDPGAGPTSTQACCGTKGPGTLYLTPPAGSYTIIQYRAIPVTPGTTYRVALDSLPASASATPGFWVRAFESNANTPAVQFVRVSSCCLNPGDVAYSHATDIAAAATTMPGNVWTHYEWTYTVPAGTYWVSLTIQNWTCQVGACTSFHVDNVEMQLQIGAGHIRANSITADRLVANSITAAQIAAGTITSTQIAANTITGGNIAGRTITAGLLVANTITSNEIGVRAIVAGNIATGTLTANEIASATITGDRIAAGTINANNIQAGSITADRLAVTSLSAISANLGNITAGTITSVTDNSSTINSPTINAGCTTINSNGITLTPGQASTCNWYKWNNGAGLYHDGGAWMGVSGASFRVDTPGGAGFLIDSNFNLNANTAINLNGYVTVAAGRTLTVSNLSGSGNRLVCTNNNGQLYTSAANGSC